MFSCSTDRETITHLDALAISSECQAHFSEWLSVMVNLHFMKTRIFLTHVAIILITWTKSPLAESCPRLTLSMASLITRLTGSSTMTQVPVSDLARHLLTCIITKSLSLIHYQSFLLFLLTSRLKLASRQYTHWGSCMQSLQLICLWHSSLSLSWSLSLSLVTRVTWSKIRYENITDESR